METTQSLVKKILDEKKISKYRLAKYCNVSWSTLQFWYKGVFEANENHRQKLIEISK